MIRLVLVVNRVVFFSWDHLGSLSTSALGSNEMQFGSITFQSVTGDIVMENTDVIVNVTNENFTSKAGVSKAILEAAGPEIEAECARLALQPHNGFVTTQNGKLPCKKIIHLAPYTSIKTEITKVLQECEAKQYASVAFPVIGTERLPEQWEDMKGSHAKLVPLHSAGQEYKDVEKIFRIGCPTFTIEKIERVQNPYLWQAYQVKKKQIETQNGHENNEKVLFHGTPHSTLVPIYQTGFNRSYAGKNAAMIGNGTYFAVNSNYSALDTYATPDQNGRKYMYVARVLTGDYCIGRSGQVIPPSKNNGGFVLYDSVTDNTTQPSMFVIFHDAQAYPEYLITFRR
uniref:Poly [ADP-ribose] polymerase n=1 Tax=Naja naja TaxID=35670 RepID=A0A8C6Y4L2_NAJNA